jgi:hypothetical protein
VRTMHHGVRYDANVHVSYYPFTNKRPLLSLVLANSHRLLYYLSSTVYYYLQSTTSCTWIDRLIPRIKRIGHPYFLSFRCTSCFMLATCQCLAPNRCNDLLYTNNIAREFGGIRRAKRHSLLHRYIQSHKFPLARKGHHLFPDN